jgi:hypothetical protein
MAQKKTTRRSERRRAPRADAKLSMRVDHGPRDGAQIVTESQNISASGIYCQCTEYFPPASKVALTIVLPKLPGMKTPKELIKVEGIVVRCEQGGSKKADRHYDLACMFNDLDTTLRRRLEDFVTWRNLQSLRAAAGAVAAPRRAVRKRAVATPRAAKTTARRRIVH